MIPGVSIDTAEYANFADKALEGMVDNVVDRNKDLQKMLDDMNNINNSIAENKSKFAADLNKSTIDIQNRVKENESTRTDRVANRNNWLTDIEGKINGALDLGNSAKNKIEAVPVKSVGGKLDGAGEVNISDEDLKYLKDFAEQEFVNKFTSATLAPNVTVTFGDVHETADADAIKGRIAQILEEEIAEVAEGVYS